MSGYVINRDDQNVFKSTGTFKQGWDGIAACYHELGYSLGGTQYKAKIIAESFEIARDMILKSYGHKKGFNLDTQMVGNEQTTIHDFSPYMKRELIKVWSKEIDPLDDRGV